MTKSTEEKLPKEVTNAAWVIALGAIAPMLDSTMVNIAINDLGKSFHATLDTIQWAITGYVLALAIAVPISGWLMNRLNGKKVFMWATIAFGVFSVLSGLSWNVESFIFFRVFQGASSGIIIPLMTTLLMKVAGADAIGRLMAVIGTPIILGPIFGPVIGGMIVQYLDWRWIFFVNVPVVILAVWLNIRILPNYEPFAKEKKLDWIGIILLSFMSASLIYGISKAAKYANFFNHETGIFVGLGILLIIGYVFHNKVQKNNTVLPLKLFQHKSFLASSFGLFLSGIAINGPMLLLPLFFQNVRNFSIINSAILLIPQGIGMLVTRPTIGKLIDKMGAKILVATCLVIALVGSVPLIFIDRKTNILLICLILFVRGMGINGITMSFMADAYTGLESKEIPEASIGSRILQNLGSSFGSAVVATAVATAISTMKMNVSTLTYGYQIGFLVSVLVLFVEFIPVFFLTDKRKK